MARDLKFRFRKYELFAYAKTKALISFAVTALLICVFVFAYAKSLFSHDRGHMMGCEMPSSVAGQPGLCGTWSDTPKTGFLTTRLKYETV